MKKLLCLLLSAVLLLSLFACTTDQPQTETKTQGSATAGTTVETQEPVDDTPIRLMALQGPTGMGLATLLHKEKEGSGNRAKYDAELVTSAEISNIAAAIAKGECDIAAVPINLASTLYGKTEGKVQVIAANTKGVLYLLENGETVKSVEDLKGKTIYATGQGSTPEYVLRYVLQENGIDPDQDVTVTFVADHTELASYLANDIYAIGMLPEPNVTVVRNANPSFRIALDMTKEWSKVSDGKGDLIQGVFIARSAFVEEHPTLVQAFLADYEDSQALVNSDPEKGAEYAVEAGILANAAVAKAAIPGCNIVCLTGEDMKNGVKACLEVLLAAEPASVGGKLPEADFYFAG